MLTILLHSSKTMRSLEHSSASYQQPQFLAQAVQLDAFLKTLDSSSLQACMHLSPNKAAQTYQLIQSWTTEPASQRPALDSFTGDIYSGLQVHDLTPADRHYANEHLIILSGLYGGLRALDSIHPYRLEMGYRFANDQFKNLYAFWQKHIAEIIPQKSTVINVSAAEYTKAVLPHISNRVVTPKFLTMHPKTGQPTFVTVHAKIARGAFAHWLIRQRIHSESQLSGFTDLGYVYDEDGSTLEQPVFICQTFEGLGLSVRQTNATSRS